MRKEKIALVTGGNRGLGKAICETLAEEGILVIFTYRNTSTISSKPNIRNVELDITDAAQCSNLIAKLNKSGESPNILINNAGITQDAFFHKMSPSQWHDVINTNLTSLYNITHPAYTQMRLQGWGRIVNISSVNARKGQYGQTNYCASKAGIEGFTRALALEAANSGITVNTISPGYTNTDMVISLSDAIKSRIEKQIPKGRFAEVTEVANLICYIVSDSASCISGATFDINGGLHMS